MKHPKDMTGECGCKVIPVFERHGDVSSFRWFECPDCGMKYAPQDVETDGMCVSFNKTL